MLHMLKTLQRLPSSLKVIPGNLCGPVFGSFLLLWPLYFCFSPLSTLTLCFCSHIFVLSRVVPTVYDPSLWGPHGFFLYWFQRSLNDTVSERPSLTNFIKELSCCGFCSPLTFLYFSSHNLMSSDKFHVDFFVVFFTTRMEAKWNNK